MKLKSARPKAARNSEENNYQVKGIRKKSRTDDPIEIKVFPTVSRTSSYDFICRDTIIAQVRELPGRDGKGGKGRVSREAMNYGITVKLQCFIGS